MKVPLRPGKIWRPVLWVLVIAYFLIDAISVSLLKPLRKWLDRVDAFRRLAQGECQAPKAGRLLALSLHGAAGPVRRPQGARV